MARVGFIQDELDLKMLVLYIMSRVAAPITFNQLLELALCDAGVDYFSLTQAVGDLVEKRQLDCIGDRYSISENGRRNSRICESSLTYSVRLRCNENLVKVNAALRREEQVQSGVELHKDGTCTVRLHLSDDSGELMDLRILTSSGQAGDALTARFKEKPEGVYHAVMAALEQQAEPKNTQI